MKRGWERAFLAALASSGTVTSAAEAAGISRVTAHRWKASDPEFAKLWDDAIETAADTLEDEARRRAFKGSDTLLIFLLKGMRPEKFRESRTSIPPAELNKMIEAELKRLAASKEDEASSQAVN